jgi:hypothetical protein
LRRLALIAVGTRLIAQFGSSPKHSGSRGHQTRIGKTAEQRFHFSSACTNPAGFVSNGMLFLVKPASWRCGEVANLRADCQSAQKGAG